MVAQAIALREPKRVDKLVILASVAGRTPEERRTVWERAENLVKGNVMAHAQKAAAERWFTDAFRAKHPEVVEARIARSMEADREGYAAAYRVFAENDFIDELPNIRHETLVATGEHDPTGTARIARLMAERIPDARIRIFPGLRHGLLLEAPDQVAAVLRDFLVGESAAV